MSILSFVWITQIALGQAPSRYDVLKATFERGKQSQEPAKLVEGGNTFAVPGRPEMKWSIKMMSGRCYSKNKPDIAQPLLLVAYEGLNRKDPHGPFFPGTKGMREVHATAFLPTLSDLQALADYDRRVYDDSDATRHAAYFDSLNFREAPYEVIRDFLFNRIEKSVPATKHVESQGRRLMHRLVSEGKTSVIPGRHYEFRFEFNHLELPLTAFNGLGPDADPTNFWLGILDSKSTDGAWTQSACVVDVRSDVTFPQYADRTRRTYPYNWYGWGGWTGWNWYYPWYLTKPWHGSYSYGNLPAGWLPPGWTIDYSLVDPMPRYRGRIPDHVHDDGWFRWYFWNPKRPQHAN